MNEAFNLLNRVRSAAGGLDMGRVLKMNDISTRTQDHLKKTYMALCAGVVLQHLGVISTSCIT